MIKFKELKVVPGTVTLVTEDKEYKWCIEQVRFDLPTLEMAGEVVEEAPEVVDSVAVDTAAAGEEGKCGEGKCGE